MMMAWCCQTQLNSGPMETILGRDPNFAIDFVATRDEQAWVVNHMTENKRKIPSKIFIICLIYWMFHSFLHPASIGNETIGEHAPKLIVCINNKTVFFIINSTFLNFLTSTLVRPAKDLRCRQYLGQCVDWCYPILQMPAKDCETGSICCVLNLHWVGGVFE